MKRSSHVRKRFTPAQREEILKAYQNSGLTQKQFAFQAGISVSGLQGWLRQAAGAKTAHRAGFVRIPNLLRPLPTPAAYRLHWPNGLVLELRQGFQVRELSSLLQLVQVL